MEKQPPKPMTPFDELITPHIIYTIKLLLPYFPASMQRVLAVFVKFTEFRNTLDTFYGFNQNSSSPTSETILSDLKPYMDPKELEMMDQMEGMMNMMEMMQQMQAAQNFSDDAAEDTSSPFDFLKGMMSPEQQNMFDIYSNIFESEMNAATSETQNKGDSNYE